MNRPFLRVMGSIKDRAQDWNDNSRPEPDPWTLHPTDSDVQAITQVLRERVQQGGDRELAVEALLALATVNVSARRGEGSPVEPLLRPYLDHTDPLLREGAFHAFGICAGPESIALLLDLLSPHKGVRDRVVPNPLTRKTRALAVYSVGRIGAGVDEPRSGDVAFDLEVMLRNSVDPEFQRIYLQALGVAYLQRLTPAPDRVCLPGRLDLVLVYLQDSERTPEVRASAAWALARCVQSVDGTAAERWAASAMQRVVEALLTHANDDEAPPALRRQAVLALGSLGRGALPYALRTRLLETLESVARDEDASRAACALVAIATLGSDPRAGGLPARAAAFLIERLDGPEALRPWAAIACGVMGCELALRRSEWPRDSTSQADQTPKEIGELRTAVHERLVAGRSDVVACAVAAVLLADSGAMLWILEQLGTAPSARRRDLALVLGQAHAEPEYAEAEEEFTSLRSAIPSLRERMRAAGDDAELVVALARFRHWLGDKTLGLDSLAGIAGSSDATRCAWIDALAVTESARAIEPFTKLLADQEQPVTVRVHAARALGELRTGEFVPWTIGFLRDLDLASAPAVLLDPLVR